MQSVILAISITMFFITILFSIMIIKKINTKKEVGDINVKDKINMLSKDSNSLNEMIVSIEELPALSTEDESMLTEITDKKVLAQINSLIPGLMQVGNAVYNATQASGQTLYQVIIPAGEKLAKSKDIPNAFRGIYLGDKGIKGQANLVAVDQSRTVNTNIVASLMGVASMVVGQYYMAEISTELTKIREDISKVVNFQNNEYKSKVNALITQIKEMV